MFRRLRNTYGGMTLVELTVCFTIGVVITGVVLGILSTASKSSRENISHERTWQELRLARKSVRAILSNYVPPDEAIAIADKPEFLSESISIPATVASNKSRELVFCTIKNDTHEDGTRRIFLLKQSVGKKEPAKPIQEKIGSTDANLDVSISFRYAERYEALEPVWVSKLDKGATPKIVEYVIKVSNQKFDKKIRTVKYTGAVAF